MNDVKKQRKTIEWERLEISSRKLELSRERHVRMGMIKDRNDKDLTEAEEIKMRWQEYIEELYQKGLKDLDNHDGVVTPLEPDVLECEALSGPQEASLRTKLEEVMEFQLSWNPKR